MDVLFASIIAVAGTLLGSTTTYVFQRLSAGHAEAFARDEQLRQERLAAYSAFAGAITELRQGVVAVWFRQHRDHPDPEGLYAQRVEADRRGAAADHARFRVQMLARDHDLVRLAGAVREPIDAIYEAADLPELKEHEKRCHELVKAFIAAAGDQVL